MKKKLIIFGGSGFIGYNLIKYLDKLNFKITAVARQFPPKKKYFKNVEFIKCNINNYKNLKKIKFNYDCLINLSGNINHKNKKQTYKIHYLGCKNLLKFFLKKKIKTFIQAGSSLEYGSIKVPHKEINKVHPNSNYGIAKQKASNYLIKHAKKKKFNLIILRLYQIYGPFQKFDRLIPYVIKSSLKNKKFKCSHGEQYRDFLYIDDLMSLFLKILRKKNVINGVFNVGYGKPEKVKNIIKLIVKLVKKGTPKFGSIKMRIDENLSNYPDINKITKTFNWRPKFGIKVGLKKTINFYKKLT